MVSKEYRDRHCEIYFPSTKFLQKWQARAEAANMPLSRWIFEIVEATEEGEPPREEPVRNALHEESRQLRADLRKSDARINELETENFKLRNQIFLQAELRGKGKFEKGLIEALRSGGIWSGCNLLEELEVNAQDIDAIQIVTRQLQILQDLGLVGESVGGWRWIG